MMQTVLPSQIIIADDGSDDRTKKIIDNFTERAILNIKHVWHEDLGFRKTVIMNKALKYANHDYVVQIDGDIILDKNFIKDHLEQAEKGFFVRGTRSHISESFVSQMIDQQKVDFKFWSKGVKNRFNAIRIPSLTWLMTKREKSGRNVRGCNMAFWKSDFIKVNGYDNDLCGWGHEDEELATRFVNNGIMKKSVKLACVQYHIFHKLASRAREDMHDSQLMKVRDEKILIAENGYNEL